MKALKYLAAIAALAAVGCVHQAEQPPLSGPSDFALSMSVTTSPQTITQNGSDKSVITVKAFFTDSTGQTKPKANLPIRFDMQVNGVMQDFGTLSARSAATDANGVAQTQYTAPPMPVGGSSGSGCNGVPGQCVTIVATTTDTSAANNSTASAAATIALVPQGVILPPAQTPVAAFNVSPTPVAQGGAATFDASASCPVSPSNGSCPPNSGSIVTFAWSFGDGSSGSGKTVSHTFNTAATFNVTLTVTNDRGISASTTQSITVGAVTGPQANFVFSPATPAVGQTVLFNASTSTAATGHLITTYTWDFGDGATSSGLVATHAYVTAGTYNAVLTVTDDLGQKNSKTASVAVTTGAGAGGGGGQTTASFAFSPLTPSAGQPIFFNASSSTAAPGHTLTNFAWDFGDGTTFAGSLPTASHAFASAGSFSVSLTVTDDSGQKATTKNSITVAAASAGSLTAAFTISPTNPSSGTLVTFNANTSTPIASITQFDWDFGDGVVVNNGGMIINHTYNNNTGAALTFVIRLTVHDASGNTNSTSNTLPVLAGSDPTAVFTISPNPATLAGASVTVNFDGSASTTNGGVGSLTYQWNFGDGSALATGATPSHAYTAKGTYTITLTVTRTDNGHTNATSHTLVVQ